MITLPPPPDFRGLDPELPVTVYHRNLPHWRQRGATYFVTFRLADSLPAGCRPPHSNAVSVSRPSIDRQRNETSPPDPGPLIDETVEEWLDRGYGSCVLKSPLAVRIVDEAMRHFDGERHLLFASVVMPNHVHAVLKPSDLFPLEKVLRSWKWFTAGRLNQLHGRLGAVWQDESYDRIIRDLEELDHVVQYIGRNPEKAGFEGGSRHLWIRPDWEAAGWGFREP